VGEPIKINLGCGERIIDGYINVDLSTIEEIKERYPQKSFSADIKTYQYDICNLPFPDDSVDEIKTDSMLEHLSFIEEKKLFFEIQRVLKKGGRFIFSVPDFEHLVKRWLQAEEDWRDFYRTDKEAITQQHWFGQFSNSDKSRWGILTACLYGPQNSEGQFHKNCYTVGKVQAILKHIDFIEEEISFFKWKDYQDQMILVKAVKR